MEDMAKTNLEGIVTRSYGKCFLVFADGRSYDCQLRGRVKFKTEQTTPVAVGDDVTICVTDKGEGVIESVHERRESR